MKMFDFYFNYLEWLLLFAATNLASIEEKEHMMLGSNSLKKERHLQEKNGRERGGIQEEIVVWWVIENR